MKALNVVEVRRVGADDSNGRAGESNCAEFLSSDGTEGKIAQVRSSYAQHRGLLDSHLKFV